jgi:F-type H+-transporting ATPase subunit b
MLAAASLTASAGLLTPNATLIAEIIVFLLMVGVLWRWVYPPVIRMAEEREKKIAAGLQHAAEAEQRLVTVKDEVDKILDEARSQAQLILSRAQRDAVAQSEELRATTREDADAYTARVREEIAAERDRALRELRAHVGALVVAAAGRVLGESVDVDAHRRLIDSSVAQIEALPR